MTFYVENESGVEFPFSIEETVSKISNHILEKLQCPFEVQLNVLITDAEGITAFNRDYRGMDKETDVLSFPNLDFMEPGDYSCAEESESEADYFDPDTGELILGDIIISANKVTEQAAAYGHSLIREFSFLVAHSLLHLSGYDHEEGEEASLMEQLQEEILEELGITRELK